VKIFCVKAENFFNVCWSFTAFPASFCLLVFAGTYQQQGETLPKFILKASSRHIFNWVTIFQLFLVYLHVSQAISLIFLVHLKANNIADTLGVCLA
jgi:hypothetical protein